MSDAAKQFKTEVRKMMEKLARPEPGDEDLSKWVRSSKAIDSLVKLPGDASTRSYYRLVSAGKSYIAMRMVIGKHLAHYCRGFSELGAMSKAHFMHGINNSAMNRF